MNTIEYKNPSQQITVAMPVRIDSEERKANIESVIQYICKMDCKIVLLEADKTQLLKSTGWNSLVEYKFVFDDNPVFHRTHYINTILNNIDSEIVVVWDSDILVRLGQITEAVKLIKQGYTIVYPYNGEYVMLPEKESIAIRHNFDEEYLGSKKFPPIFKRPFCGGIFLVQRQHYLLCGGENESYTGWGPEDAERLRRIRILGHKVAWINKGQAYHLYHPRGKNSNFFTDNDAIRMREELVKICSMNKDELTSYITGAIWKHQTKN
jgi:predicted glycosyltransferase involved in capsule biosynthesis